MSERSRIAELLRALTEWAPGDPPAVDWLLPELRELLRAELMGAYRPARSDSGWSLDFMQLLGDNAAAKVQAFKDYVSRLPDDDVFLDYSPTAVPTGERNRALSVGDLARLRGVRLPQLPHKPLFRALEITRHDQIRVLLSSGSKLLGWVGATRVTPFTKREVALLGRVGTPLRERLSLELKLHIPGLRAAALDAALEAIGRPAFVVGPGDTIEIANSAGLALLAGDRKGVLEAIRHSGADASGGGAFSITRIALPGCPAYRLAIESEHRFVLVDRLGLAARKWNLTERQVRVLELAATGASNKEIAAKCGCAEVTVESHLTELFRRSGARSRADLVGRFFRLLQG